MKTQFKITIEADLDYPGLKNTKKIEKAINDWLIEFSTNPNQELSTPIPILYDSDRDHEITLSHHADAKIKITIEKEGKAIYTKEWEDIGNPYGD